MTCTPVQSLNKLVEPWTATTLPLDWTRTRDAWNRANAWRAGCSALLFMLGLAALTWRAAGELGVQHARHTTSAPGDSR
jgi:hypothetical protein